MTRIVNLACACALLAGAVSGCKTVSTHTGPVAADEFPLEWRIVTTSAEDGAIETDLKLCAVDRKRRLWPIPDRDDSKPICIDWTSSIQTPDDRNNLQHALFGIATSLCTDFRATLARQPKKSVWVRIVAGLLSAASPVVSAEKTADVVAAAGSAANVTAGELDSYLDDERVKIALLGIELARTDLFKKLIKDHSKSLSQYPVNRAINDAFRYHGVCNLQDGLSVSADAVGDRIGAGG